jgi:hypothetical protein
MIVSILIPVCSRNQNYKSFDDIPFITKFYPSFLATKSSSITYKIYIGYDDDDMFYVENIEKFKVITENLICLTGCQHAPAKAWNILAEKAYPTSDYLFQIGDDVILETPNWTECFIERLLSNNNIGVVGPCNLVNYNQRKRSNSPIVIENAFVSKKHFECFGYFFHPTIKNWFCDNWITRIYDNHLSEMQLDFTCRNTIIDVRYNIQSPPNFEELVHIGIRKIKLFVSKKIFSYCVFGNQKKYCLGMTKNLEQIKTLFPDYKVIIYLGNDVPQEYINQYKTYDNVTLIQLELTGLLVTIYRYLVIDDDYDVLFVRDADSRFGDRDIWCINHFLNSDYNVFTIRDHPLHGRELMAGQFGIKNIKNISIQEKLDSFIKEAPVINYYQNDQDFIQKYIFNPYKDNTIAYSEFHYFGEKEKMIIPIPRKSVEDFCGNVYLFDEDNNEYTEFTMHGRK